MLPRCAINMGLDDSFPLELQDQSRACRIVSKIADLFWNLCPCCTAFSVDVEEP